MLERATLSQEHRAIADVVAQMRVALIDRDFVATDMVKLRWRLAHLLAGHLAKEDRILYPRLKANRDAALAALASRYEAEMGGLSAAYRAYMTGWDVARIEGERARFVRETLGVLDLLGKRIEKEETELYPMYEKLGGR